MAIVTLKNSFHNTEVRVRSTSVDPGETWEQIQYAAYGVNHPTASAKRRLKRVEKALCGMEGCTCGTVR